MSTERHACFANGKVDSEQPSDTLEAIAGPETAVKRRTGRRRRGRPRGRTIAVKRITRAELQIGRQMYPVDSEMEALRPQTRGECRGTARPCPWVACKHHLYLDVNPETGSIKINFPDLEPWELRDTCALDVAERGGITLDEIGEVTNLTRERIRQIEVRGLLKLKSKAPHPEGETRERVSSFALPPLEDAGDF